MLFQEKEKREKNEKNIGAKVTSVHPYEMKGLKVKVVMLPRGTVSLMLSKIPHIFYFC